MGFTTTNILQNPHEDYIIFHIPAVHLANTQRQIIYQETAKTTGETKRHICVQRISQLQETGAGTGTTEDKVARQRVRSECMIYCHIPQALHTPVV